MMSTSHPFFLMFVLSFLFVKINIGKEFCVYSGLLPIDSKANFLFVFLLQTAIQVGMEDSFKELWDQNVVSCNYSKC